MERVVVGDSLKKADHSSWSPATAHGVVSPSSSSAAAVPRTWRSPSPVYNAYRTGWLPAASRPASHATAVTSPLSLYQQRLHEHRQNGEIDTSPSFNYSSRLQLSFSTPEKPLPSSSRVVCGRSQDTKSQPVCAVGPAVDSVVNGYCHVSEVCGDGPMNMEPPRSGDECVEQRNCSASSTSVDPAPVLSSSSQETLRVEVLPKILNGSDELVSSVECSNSVAEKNESMTSRCVKVANAVKHSEHLDHYVVVPDAGLMGHQGDVVGDSTSTDQTHESLQRPHCTDDSDEPVKQPSDDRTVTSSTPHRESDLLRSARKSSIDYSEKVTRLVLNENCNLLFKI